MIDYFSFDTSQTLLSCIDSSIKKSTTAEKEHPYAIVVNPANAKNLQLENLTYLPKNAGFKSIPIIKTTRVKQNTIEFTYNENELISLLKKKADKGT